MSEAYQPAPAVEGGEPAPPRPDAAAETVTSTTSECVEEAKGDNDSSITMSSEHITRSITPLASEPVVDSPAEELPAPSGFPDLTPPAPNALSPRLNTVQVPERQGTARPGDYRRRRRTQGDDPVADDILAAMGSIRQGTSALVSALTALPWEGDSTSSDETDDAAAPSARMARTTVMPPKRPKGPQQMHSSLHTIRAMEPTGFQHELETPSDSDYQQGQGQSRSPPLSPSSPRSQSPTSPRSKSPRKNRFRKRRLSFPYKENVITRRARVPGPNELSYQFAPTSDDEKPPPRVASSSTLKPSFTQGPDSVNPDIVDILETPIGRPAMGGAVIRGSPGDMDRSALLQEVFGLDEPEEVIEEMHCWLLRTTMLQGYMFLTRKFVCFFAHVPDGSSKTLKSGPLLKKASRSLTKFSTRYWFILRDDVLSWYENAADPYFPKGSVRLQYASSCDKTGTTRFKLRTPERSYTFQSDTVANADEWVRVIQKVMAKTQHEGESVKLIIPWEAVIDVERSPTLEFAETIEIKVVDAEDSMSVDSYFFASFPDNDYAYDLLQTLFMERPVSELPAVAPQSPQPGSETSTQQPDSVKRFSLSGLGSALPKLGGEKPDPDARVPIAAPAVVSLPEHGNDSVHSDADSEGSDDDEATRRRKGYPPRVRGPPPPGMVPTQSGWTPQWVRHSSKQLFGGTTTPTPPQARRPRPRKSSSVTEVIEPPVTTEDEVSDADLMRSRSTTSRFSKSTSDYSLASKMDMADMVDHETSRKFHETFSLSDKEVLIDHMSGSLYRVLPVSGRFYISTNYFCFRSSGMLNKTRMMVPIRQLYGMKAQKSFRFGYHGLVVIVKGYEELFLEFHSSRRRDECMTLLEERMDDIRDEHQAALALEEILPDGQTRTITDDMGGEGSPNHASMFNSTTSSFLQFKPEPMNIVCLTIGSRGDVQPYIALCKGLQAEGHTCKIATHLEYKDWIEGHGIGFGAVGGDPAKLMELCVDNGMFTISFLKEGISMFRGWLDELLNEAWVACQGADLLIESPSAMAGAHIAEALRIPYYRAFTMLWTRTRAYPQAFAVPEHKRGGSYNYMTYVMFDQVFWHAISGQVNRWRKNVLGLRSTNAEKLQLDKVPFLYNFSPHIVPPPLDWTEWIHVSGYWFLDNADGKKDWEPPAGIVEFIDKAHALGKKVVYIGFGSIVVSDPHEMTRCVVQGIVDSGVCAILSKGWSDRGSRGKTDQPEAKDSTKYGADGVEYPPEIFAVDAIDHSWLFPRIDAACHHGGAGTTGASLRAGLPTIIKPFFGDQFFWAERVESLGVGSALRRLTYEGLAQALRDATTNERQIAKARVIGQAIRAEDGVARAIESLYRDLDYARSLIKPEPPGHARQVSKTSSHTSSISTPLSSAFKHSRGVSGDHDGAGPQSDGSWSVVSDAEQQSPPPPSGSVPASEVEQQAETPPEHHHHHRLPVIGHLVSHLLHPHHHHHGSDSGEPGSPSSQGSRRG